jgi:hypothetical protein
MSFTVSTGPPDQALLISPFGSITTNTPTYKWETVSNATWYYLWVNGPSGNVIQQWYKASDVTSGFTCSATPSTTLATGAHTWWIRTWNSSGYGPWSSGMSFTVSPGGFNSQFNGDMTGWNIYSGQWWIASSLWLTTQGLANSFSSVGHNDSFTDFDYQAKLWRNGDEDWSNSIIIRGKPDPVGSLGEWNDAYYFQYTRSGKFSVFKIVGQSASALQSWTTTSAINTGNAWNTLRVVASGSKFHFYINDTLVWSGSDSTFMSGKVGIAMASEYATSCQLWVDWAVLTEGAPDITDTISDEQKALNEEANKNPDRGDIYGVKK